ncbi:hypothetical protein BDA96_09G071100 [Sorghum bicolor]|uniref:Uncharacterized protein n=2 Tax=Sorghum bicolor TaxID=4558 RepID=A0A921Q8H5_SORBI|nr:hypothetical protein BDA96_09G071100 [Sorghum bicolor]OQU77556.1 hypothetical protein SORBI_3009G067551 [Sorghum bicolor]
MNLVAAKISHESGLATSKIQYRTEWTAPQAGKVKAAMVTQYCILSQIGWKIKMVKSP